MKLFRRSNKEPKSTIVYGGPPYRIYTTDPTTWRVQQYVLGERWTTVVTLNTKRGCQEWIDSKIQGWIVGERSRLEAVEYQKNNPPEAYP